MQAILDAMTTLGFLSDDGRLCTVRNQAVLYTGVKPVQH